MMGFKALLISLFFINATAQGSARCNAIKANLICNTIFVSTLPTGGDSLQCKDRGNNGQVNIEASGEQKNKFLIPPRSSLVINSDFYSKSVYFDGVTLKIEYLKMDQTQTSVYRCKSVPGL